MTPAIEMTPEVVAQLELKEIFMDDFEEFCVSCLKIRTKNGELIPFELNEAQLILHEKLEKQAAERGFVDAMILKGRQMGISTYIQARFYWKTHQMQNLSAFILTHDKEATQNLFNITKRYHDNMPDGFKPIAKTNSRNELRFNDLNAPPEHRLDSDYSVGTAGNREVGRSRTIHLFHGSEVAFWMNPLTTMTGLGQAIPKNTAGVEKLLESTANGMGNWWHTKWQGSERGEGTTEAIFLSWLLMDEYVAPVPDDFETTDTEQGYIDNAGMTAGQIMFRRDKIADLGGDKEAEKKFMQEYPINPAEAFQTTGERNMLRPDRVMEAANTVLDTKLVFGATVMGLDPSWGGKDFSGITIRQGRKIHFAERFKEQAGTNYSFVLANTVIKLIREYNVDMVFLDIVGIGVGVHDALLHLGYGEYVTQIWSGNPADGENAKLYFNKRCEMWAEMAEWVNDGGVQIPQNEVLHAEMCSPTYRNSLKTNQMILESKEEMRKRGIKSPDLADSAAFTFAYPVEWDFSQHSHEDDEYRTEEGRNMRTGY